MYPLPPSNLPHPPPTPMHCRSQAVPYTKKPNPMLDDPLVSKLLSKLGVDPSGVPPEPGAASLLGPGGDPGTPSRHSSAQLVPSGGSSERSGHLAAAALRVDVRAWEIPFQSLDLERLVGEGSFGKASGALTAVLCALCAPNNASLAYSTCPRPHSSGVHVAAPMQGCQNTAGQGVQVEPTTVLTALPSSNSAVTGGKQLPGAPASVGVPGHVAPDARGSQAAAQHGAGAGGHGGGCGAGTVPLQPRARKPAGGELLWVAGRGRCWGRTQCCRGAVLQHAAQRV